MPAIPKYIPPMPTYLPSFSAREFFFSKTDSSLRLVDITCELWLANLSPSVLYSPISLIRPRPQAPKPLDPACLNENLSSAGGD